MAHPAAAASAPRRRKAVGHRRRVEDEADDDAAHNGPDYDDLSLSDGSAASDETDQAGDSDTSNIDDASPTAPDAKSRKPDPAAAVRSPTGPLAGGGNSSAPDQTDTDRMLNGFAPSLPDQASPPKPLPPLVVSSDPPAPRAQDGQPHERRRREHDEYRRRRDEDPSFVPNRGNFFMHDHRQGGPSNGFRPFNRPRGGGRGRGGYLAHIPVYHNPVKPQDPTTSGPWAHDMHESVARHPPARQHRRYDGPVNGNGIIPVRPSSSTPINRSLSTEKQLGSVHLRVFLPPMASAKPMGPIPFKQYTKLPDHRPPLRRDKPVRISLPGCDARYVFPAPDRSFVFIPRAMRPNQQRGSHSRPRSHLGSFSNVSRRTSIFGGSYYSVYTPTIALSRRSSIAPTDYGREFMVSPAASVMSRPALPVDAARPIVRLPPAAGRALTQAPLPVPSNATDTSLPPVEHGEPGRPVSRLPPPHTHPLPQKPPASPGDPVRMYQPRPQPQKTVSVAQMESPAAMQQPSQADRALQAPAPQAFQQAFHHQVPVQMARTLSANRQDVDRHSRGTSHSTRHSTPMSGIPQRAVHAAPFQPIATTFQPGAPSYPLPHAPHDQLQPQPQHLPGPAQQGYFYPYPTGPPSATTPAFVPAAQHMHHPHIQAPQMGYAPVQPDGQQQHQHQQPPPPPPPPTAVTGATAASGSVAHEANGMVYYFDPSQFQAAAAAGAPVQAGYPPYMAPPATQAYVPVPMPGVVAPGPDAYFYPPVPPPHAVMYYPPS